MKNPVTGELHTYELSGNMSDGVRTTLESGGPHPHHDEHDPTASTSQSTGKVENEGETKTEDGRPKTEWSSYMVNVYAGRKPPSIGSYDIGKLEERARGVTREYHGLFSSLSHFSLLIL